LIASLRVMKEAAWPVAASLLLVLSTATAAPPKPEMLAACAACHGPNGNSQIPQFPSLAGQPRTFTENQLVLIREGLRDVPQMKEVVTGMSDETIVALATYFAEQKPIAARSPTVRQDSYRAGERLSKQNLCATCHLADYSGQSQVPRLAGQHEPYLLESMKQFRDNPGPGRDTIMAATLRGMSDGDLAHLAHYLANFGK
jgi:cytochrome c553